MYKNTTQGLAENVNAIGFSDLPESLVDKIKLMLLDDIGCALGASLTDRARIILEFVEEFGGNPQASVIGGHRTSCALAAFANGELINALDYSYNMENWHVDIFVTPPCLAAAEQQHSSGADLITALAIAHEVGVRAISSMAQHKVLIDEPPYYQESPRFGYSTTVFGGVAGAGKLFGLDVKEMQNAFGVAGASTAVPALQKWSHTSGPIAMIKYGSWSGWVAQLAMTAVVLASKGFTGDITILDGEWGYWQIVGSPFFKTGVLLDRFGQDWRGERADFKPYPCCSCNFGGIEAITRLIKEHEIKPEDIDEILIKADPSLSVPMRMDMSVESFGDVQFHNALIFAIAAYYGDNPGPNWQLPSTYNDPRVRALMEKVKVEVYLGASEFLTKLIEANTGAFFPNTAVTITAKGKKFTIEVASPKGYPSNPMTKAEVIEKFKNNAQYSRLRSSRIHQIMRMVGELEKVDDVTELTRLTTVT